MEKYATYTVYKNIYTNEIKRVPVGEDSLEEFLKTAAFSEWVELDNDPELNNETTSKEKNCS